MPPIKIALDQSETQCFSGLLFSTPQFHPNCLLLKNLFSEFSNEPYVSESSLWSILDSLLDSSLDPPSMTQGYPWISQGHSLDSLLHPPLNTLRPAFCSQRSALKSSPGSTAAILRFVIKVLRCIEVFHSYFGEKKWCRTARRTLYTRMNLLGLHFKRISHQRQTLLHSFGAETVPFGNGSK